MDSRGGVGGRFGGFAAGHVLCSVLYLFLLALFPLGNLSPAAALALAYLLPAVLYLLAGWLTALLRRWPRPDGKTALLAVLLPTLCAWGWVAVSAGFGALGVLTGLSALETAGSVMLFSSVFWAPASAVFVLLAMLYSLAGLPWLWLVCIPLAGLLPPLLFFLGSLLPSCLIGVEPAPPPKLPKNG